MPNSRQVLRGLRVGTNAPVAEELAGVPCHLLGIVDPGAGFSVADWLSAALVCLADLDRRGVRPIVVGGTGLYVRALLDGLDLDGGAPDPARRAALNARAASPEGLAALAAELRAMTRRERRASTCATPAGWFAPSRSSRPADASPPGGGAGPPGRASGSGSTSPPIATDGGSPSGPRRCSGAG